MTPRHWLIKFAPFRTSWAEIVARGIFTPRGIRSQQACKHLKSMQLGDSVFFFQSQQDQAVRGLMEVARTAYPDPTSADPVWLTCDFRPLRSFFPPLSLAAIRSEESFAVSPLLRQPRLAVMPITDAEAGWIIGQISLDQTTKDEDS
jgi:predicted RNA-binding protein with PUA-like domain